MSDFVKTYVGVNEGLTQDEIKSQLGWSDDDLSKFPWPDEKRIYVELRDRDDAKCCVECYARMGELRRLDSDGAMLSCPAFSEHRGAWLYRMEHHVVSSATGLEWGYGGSGPYDTALSILWDYLGEEPARRLAMRFKFDVVAMLPRKPDRLLGRGEYWRIPQADIDEWLELNALRGRG